MYNVPWQNGRVFQTPVGILTASFVLRPNTMFHPEGEWSVRLVLPHLQAYRLRQLIAPAYDDVVARAKDMYLQLPLEQQARRPFKENAFWQAASTEGGQETENISFSFRLPTIDRPVAATAEVTEPAVATGRGKVEAAGAADAAAGNGSMLEVSTRVPLFNRQGEEMTGLSLEPDGWSASVHFSIHQYWLRTFGAGVTLRLSAVQLFSQHQHPDELIDEVGLPLPIAL